ncbi:MAG: hypothetical protein EXR93_11790 [Gemmatimonadetes bacterium]|nr:hypothetical protein [Gemmatimonadota bacterium]
MFLNRTSPDAVSTEGGDWVADPDPLQTVMTGFRLNAFLKLNPAVNGSKTLEPEYSCVPHAFGFEGGDEGQSGYGGPDVTVRLNVLRSPFYAKLIVAAIEVAMAPAVYVGGDYNTVPPADWLVVESRGGRGGRGRVSGRAGWCWCTGRAGRSGWSRRTGWSADGDRSLG